MQATRLPPLLGALFPAGNFSDDENGALLGLQRAIDATIAPLAIENDRRGRYPTKSIAALKRSGFLKAVLPVALGGTGLSRRASLEAQLRLAVADPAVAQIYKVHDEIIREMLAICRPEFAATLATSIVDEDAIIGLAIAEAGSRVDTPLATLAVGRPGGGFVVTGRKIYTTGAAEADRIATWTFNPALEGPAGMQLILIPANTQGIVVHRDWDALGQRATDSGSVSFDAVQTDPLWSVNDPGMFPPVHASLGYQAGFAAILAGIGIAALREAVEFVAGHSRVWPAAEVERAVDDPYVRRLTGELSADLAGAYGLILAAGDLLDGFEIGRVDRTGVAVPIYAARSLAQRAALRAASEIHALMGTRSARREAAFDRHWRNARILSLHDPVEWKHAEIGRHVLTGWEPPPGLYQ